MAHADFFTQGSLYPDEQLTQVPRQSCCGTCAFKAGLGTVRPEGVTPEDVWAETDTCDDFICHTPNADGTYPSCAGWHAFKREG